MVLMQDYSSEQDKQLIKYLCKEIMTEERVKEQSKYSEFVKRVIFDRTLQTTLLGLKVDSHLINDPEIDELA